MPAPTLLISDLHLDPARPRIQALFLRFLEDWRGRARALYILGDLFEAWIGDDGADAADPVLAALAAFAERTPLYIMHGNRDFLLGERFCALTGAQLLADPTVLDLHGVPTLLMHGDSLCTDDVEYQTLRAKLRSPEWQAQVLAQPLEARLAMAQQARVESSARNQALAEYLMDVNQGAVEQALLEHGVRRLIHGHTHRPGRHRFVIDGEQAERIVLGDWYEQGSVLEVSERGCELKELALAR